MSYRVEAILSAVDSGFTSKFNQATKSVEKLQNQANKVSGVASKIGSATESIGKSLTTKLTLPIAAAVAFSGKKFMEFEDGLIGVGKTTGMAGSDLKGFGKDILKMSSNIPVPIKELLNLSETAGQLGVHGRKDLLEFTKVMAEMGSATNLAGEEGAQVMARFANVMGLDVGDNIRQVGNAVVRLGNNFATNEGQIMDMSSRLAAASRLVGITTPNVLGLATAMSSLNISAEAGGTAMSTVMTKIDKAVSKGGAKLETFAKVSGMSAEQFSAAWKSNPTQALQSFLKGLDDVQKSGGNMNMILEALGITGVRESNAVKALAQNHEMLGKAIEDSNKAYANGNDLANEAAEAGRSLSSQIQKLINNVTGIAVEMFGILEPTIAKSIEHLNKFLEGWQKLSDGSKKAIGEIILKVGALLAAIGPVLTIGGKITKTLSPVIGVLSQVGNGFKTFSNVAGNALNSFSDGVLNKFAKKIELSMILSGNKLAKLAPMVGKAVSLANIGMQALFPAAVIGIALAGLGLLYSKFGTQIDKLLEVAKTKGPEIITNLGNGIASKIPDLVNQGATLINHFAQALAANLPAILTAGTNIVIALVQSVGNNAGKLIQSALLVVGSFLQGVMQNLPRLIVAGVTLIGQLIVGIVQNIPMIIATAGRIIAGFIDGIGQSAPRLLGSGIKIIFELIKGIVQAIPQIVLAGVEIVMALGKSILGALGNIAGSLVTGVKGFFKNIFSPGKEEAKNTKTDVETEMSGLSSTLDEMTQSLGPKFQQNANQAKIGFTSEMAMMSQETQAKLQEMANATGMSMDEIVRTVQEKGELTKGNLTIKASEINTNVSGQTDQMADNMINSITRGVDGANTQFDGLSAKLPTDASVTNQATAGQYEDLANRITSSTEQANTAVTSGIDTINSNFEMRLGTLPAKTDTILNNVSNSFTNAFNALGKGVDSNLQKIISAYSSTMAKMNSISNSGLNNLSSRFTSSFNRISATVTAGTNRIVVSIMNMNNRVNASFSQFSSRFISTNSNMWNRFNSQSTSALNRNYALFSSNISKLQSKFTSYSNKLKSLNNSMWTAVVNKTRQAGSSMASGFSSACNRMVSLASSMRSRLISIMNSSVGGMRSAGYNAGMGFYSGLASTRGSIMGLASSIAASVSARIRSALRIHSPSRVLMNLGSYAGEGLAVGLEKSKRYVNNAVDGLSNTIKGVDTGLNSSFSDFNTNSKAMPLVINLRLGNKEFRAISRDITQEQGKDLRLEANFGI